MTTCARKACEGVSWIGDWPCFVCGKRPARPKRSSPSATPPPDDEDLDIYYGWGVWA